jgi:hypothetical protein
MIFLIEYNRIEGEIVTLQKFEDAERKRAQDSRLQREIELNRLGTRHEIVLLEAATEAALRRTHRRYFENLTELEKVPA